MIPISLTFLDSTAANPVTGASLALSLFSQFRDPQKTLDNFDFIFNKKLNRSLIFDLATAGFIAKHKDALF